ncbi:MAG: sigma-70 family RNA polymerase sigma factor [Solitalea sp.]
MSASESTQPGFTDQVLIHRILKGETPLFELLVRRNNSYLYKVGRTYPFNHEDTQDLMQDTFVNAYTHLAQFEGRSSFRTWLVRIMLHNCYRKRRKWNTTHLIASGIGEEMVPVFFRTGDKDTNRTVMNKELRLVVEKALERLPSDYRMVFVLREMNGMSVSETSEALQISPANVKVRLTRAKARLRREVEKYYSADELFEFNLIYCDAMVNRVMEKIMAIPSPPAG